MKKFELQGMANEGTVTAEDSDDILIVDTVNSGDVNVKDCIASLVDIENT